MAASSIGYDKAELRKVLRAFKAMDVEATKQAQKVSNELADEAAQRIKRTAGSRPHISKMAQRVADGVKVSKTSKIGEFSYGYKSQKFSGGGNTQDLWPGIEFGSKHYKQFAPWSGRQGRGSRGYFIYPTLRAMQPYLVDKWERAFKNILRKWG